MSPATSAETMVVVAARALSSDDICTFLMILVIVGASTGTGFLSAWRKTNSAAPILNVVPSTSWASSIFWPLTKVPLRL